MAIEGGPGWVIGDDLRPLITDIDAFHEGFAGDSFVEPIELLWSGKPAEALAVLDAMGIETPRARALRADCLRDLGEHSRALTQYDALVAECAGTALEATMLQHRGKVRLVAGDIHGAVSDFQKAVALRENGDPALLASSRQALEAARRVLPPNC